MSIRVMMLTQLTCVGLAIVPGCSASQMAGPSDHPEGLRIKVEDERIAPGDTLVLTVVNSSEHEILYNSQLCDMQLLSQGPNGWIPVPRTPSREGRRSCSDEATGLLPGGQESTKRATAAHMAPGTYRFRLPVRWDTSQGSVMTDSFTVRPP